MTADRPATIQAGYIQAACHCGAVRLTLAAPPVEVTDCNCSLCRRYGVLWVYYRPDQVRREAGGATDIYMWGEREVAFHRCRARNCVTHWAAVDPSTHRTAVNGRLLDPAILAAARVRHLDGATTMRYLEDGRPACGG